MNNEIVIWDFETRETIKRGKIDYPSKVSAFDVLPNGKEAIVGFWTKHTLAKVDLETFEILHVLQEDGDYMKDPSVQGLVYDVTAVNNRNIVVSSAGKFIDGPQDTSIKIWSLDSNKKINTLVGA